MSQGVLPHEHEPGTPEAPPPPSLPPPSMRPPPPPPSAFVQWLDHASRFADHLGRVAILSVQTARALPRRPLETASLVHQMDSLGVHSMSIVAVTSIFIGMVMTIQFAWGLQRFGGLEYIPRVIVVSFLRELAPTLTAVIVGGRIGSGMAAEVGSMNVTEQVDAIRALGADPVKKLVLPRVVAAIICMPILSAIAMMLGIGGAIFVCDVQFDIAPQFFVRSSLDSAEMVDLVDGILKTPFFGFIIAIIGCYFGMTTKGGTEGVGSSTTRTVVAVSIAILVADLILTKLLILMHGAA
jgi:phospholipid/cholesterol/gamma-HCH transport system permease protein